jgi:hypothetical protein
MISTTGRLSFTLLAFSFAYKRAIALVLLPHLEAGIP